LEHVEHQANNGFVPEPIVGSSNTLTNHENTKEEGTLIITNHH